MEIESIGSHFHVLLEIKAFHALSVIYHLHLLVVQPPGQLEAVLCIEVHLVVLTLEFLGGFFDYLVLSFNYLPELLLLIRIHHHDGVAIVHLGLRCSVCQALASGAEGAVRLRAVTRSDVLFHEVEFLGFIALVVLLLHA